MRIKLTIVLGLIVGTVLAVYLLLGDQTLSPLQLTQVKAGCRECHSELRYDSPSTLHDTHAALNCSRCHRDNAGLKSTDKIHTGLKWAGLGTVLFVLAGIATNIIMVNKKTGTA